MFFVKSKRKHENVIAALIITLLFSGSVFFDMATSPKSNDCACTDDLVQVVKQAGWFFGRHCSRRTGIIRTRIFGIGFGNHGRCDTCQTYAHSQAIQSADILME